MPFFFINVFTGCLNLFFQNKLVTRQFFPIMLSTQNILVLEDLGTRVGLPCSKLQGHSRPFSGTKTRHSHALLLVPIVDTPL